MYRMIEPLNAFFVIAALSSAPTAQTPTIHVKPAGQARRNGQQIIASRRRHLLPGPSTINQPTSLEPIPVVLLSIGDCSSSVGDALQLINRFSEVDDVYSPSFSPTAVIWSSSERGFKEMLKKFEASGHFSAVYHVSPSSLQDCLRAGPYFLCDGEIHQAYRLYEDTLDSFIFGVIPDDVLNPKRYTALNLLSSNGLCKSIPVPSRLYNVRTSTTPLAGARMGIKDIFRLEGTQTTMVSRPWIELYDPDEQSADYTKKLINLGAAIVGKTKMTSFASPEEPTDQNVGKDVTSPEYETYMNQLEVFRNWFTENLMGPDSKTLFNAILIMPYGEPHPEYRDEAKPPAGTFPTMAERFISPILHAPQLVLPFAQMPYHSKISGRSEMRPIASTIIGAKGSDLMLIKLASEACNKAGWPTSIQTGRYMYPVADNARNVGSVPGESLETYEMRQRAIQELQKEFEKKSEESVCNAM